MRIDFQVADTVIKEVFSILILWLELLLLMILIQYLRKIMLSMVVQFIAEIALVYC